MREEKLLETLTQLWGVAGFEKEVRRFIEKEAAPYADEIITDAMGPIIVNTTMAISDMILSAAGLSFIGMGIQPPSPEWGVLLSAAQNFMFTSPYLLIFPGIFIVLSSLSFNLVGDGLTDALDPKLKN